MMCSFMVGLQMPCNHSSFIEPLFAPSSSSNFEGMKTHEMMRLLELAKYTVNPIRRLELYMEIQSISI